MRDAAPELDVLVGSPQEVDDLGELGLRFVDAGDVVEGDHDLLWVHATGLRATEAAQEARAARPRSASCDQDEQAHEQQRRSEAEEQLGDQRHAGVGDWALTSTPLDCRRFVRLALSQNEGTSVENRVVGFAD